MHHALVHTTPMDSRDLGSTETVAVCDGLMFNTLSDLQEPSGHGVPRLATQCSDHMADTEADCVLPIALKANAELLRATAICTR